MSLPAKGNLVLGPLTLAWGRCFGRHLEKRIEVLEAALRDALDWGSFDDPDMEAQAARYRGRRVLGEEK